MNFKIWRCKWCINRIGKLTWFNERGETVKPPACFVADESKVSDGICPQCLIEQMALIPSKQQEARP